MPARRLVSASILLRRKALYDGVFGSSRFWKGVAVVVFGKRLLGRLLGRTPEVVAVERLEPGQWIRVEALHTRRGDR